jgi:hypothetical protein
VDEQLVVGGETLVYCANMLSLLLFALFGKRAADEEKL